MFALGDRAYGEAFCAAGRKLAARLVQLGATPLCSIGYGDDGTPNGGVFADLDIWLGSELLPNILSLRRPQLPLYHEVDDAPRLTPPTYRVTQAIDNPKADSSSSNMDNFFRSLAPLTAYTYNENGVRMSPPSSVMGVMEAPMHGIVFGNHRITNADWEQDVRHIRILVNSGSPNKGTEASEPTSNEHDSLLVPSSQLPYVAGDVAVVMPRNSEQSVNRFLEVLPDSLSGMADEHIHIEPLHPDATLWPSRCNLRALLTCCADINGRPEREFLRWLSVFVDVEVHEEGQQQAAKLVELSEPNGAALYADYIIREKRNYSDVFFDFDAIRSNPDRTNILTIEHLLALLPPLRPRHFSIASSPSMDSRILRDEISYSGSSPSFALELCVAIVEGTTPLGRSYKGLCSSFLGNLCPFSQEDQDPNSSNIQKSIEERSSLRLWIRPGTFGKLPTSLIDQQEKLIKDGSISKPSTLKFSRPVMFVGAGTGIAPLRSMIRERRAALEIASAAGAKVGNLFDENILIFGCRKRDEDFHYGSEWEVMEQEGFLSLKTAYSRDQYHKIYVQSLLKDVVVQHILERQGALYIAGGANMAKCVRDEVLELLGNVLVGGQKAAKLHLKKLQKHGLFSVEAWS